MREAVPAATIERIGERSTVQRLAVIANLKPGAEKRAAELVEQGPPFRPEEIGFERHGVFLSGDHAIFVFEGGQLNSLLRAVVRGSTSTDAFKAWEELIEGMPRIAREAYFWNRGDPWPESWGE